MDSHTISLDHDLKLIRVIVFGEMFQADGELVITAARKAATENEYDILYDIRQATTTVPFENWFNLPRELNVFKDLSVWRFKAAILASPDDKAVKDYQFYELVTSNVGLRVCLFFKEKQAIEWLLKNRRTDS